MLGNIKNDPPSSGQYSQNLYIGINLEETSLDIYADSDNEHDELQEINDSQSNSKSFSKSDTQFAQTIKTMQETSGKALSKKSNCGKYLVMIFWRN